MDHFATSIAAVHALAPDLQTFCYRKDRLTAAARWFVERFPATPFYAVKANPATVQPLLCLASVLANHVRPST